MKQEWLPILHKNCRFYKDLRESKKSWFEKLLTDFMSNLNIEGRDITIDDEIKVTISGWAALLVSGQIAGTYCLNHIDTIVVHKGEQLDSGMAGEMADGFIDCRVYLAWGSVLSSIHNPFTQGNVILHELAHALDQKDRQTNGIPMAFLDQTTIEKWEQHFNLANLTKQLTIQSLWDYLGLYRWKNYYEEEQVSTWAPVEAFAVATEYYFIKPRSLYKTSPETFYLLDDFYRQYPLLDDTTYMDYAKKLTTWIKQAKELAIDIIKNIKM